MTLDKMYSFKINEKMLEKMRNVAENGHVDNWSAWIRKQINEKLKQIEEQGGNLANKYCGNCGEIVEEYDIFCGSCGKKIES
ncbi:MAG: hypothetical protein GF329_11240 [Candidatus Lokiarchaeota archaeon]|nr:hypothetical protein [Candidatus Lokiarchaeota archaeon]